MCFEQFQFVYIWNAIHFSLCHNSKYLEWKISLKEEQVLVDKSSLDEK